MREGCIKRERDRIAAAYIAITLWCNASCGTHNLKWHAKFRRFQVNICAAIHQINSHPSSGICYLGTEWLIDWVTVIWQSLREVISWFTCNVKHVLNNHLNRLKTFFTEKTTMMLTKPDYVLQLDNRYVKLLLKRFLEILCQCKNKFYIVQSAFL